MDNQILDTPFDGNRSLPNSTAVLVLGIVSIVTMCCYGIVGLACGIIALVLAKKDLTLYATNSRLYSISSLKNLNAGKICAIIGVCLSSLYLIAIIIYLAIFGAVLFTMPWKEMLNH